MLGMYRDTQHLHPHGDYVLVRKMGHKPIRHVLQTGVSDKEKKQAKSQSLRWALTCLVIRDSFFREVTVEMRLEE